MLPNMHSPSFSSTEGSQSSLDAPAVSSVNSVLEKFLGLEIKCEAKPAPGCYSPPNIMISLEGLNINAYGASELSISFGQRSAPSTPSKDEDSSDGDTSDSDGDWEDMKTNWPGVPTPASNLRASVPAPKKDSKGSVGISGAPSSANADAGICGAQPAVYTGSKTASFRPNPSPYTSNIVSDPFDMPQNFSPPSPVPQPFDDPLPPSFSAPLPPLVNAPQPPSFAVPGSFPQTVPGVSSKATRPFPSVVADNAPAQTRPHFPGPAAHDNNLTQLSYRQARNYQRNLALRASHAAAYSEDPSDQCCGFSAPQMPDYTQPMGPYLTPLHTAHSNPIGRNLRESWDGSYVYGPWGNAVPPPIPSPDPYHPATASAPMPSYLMGADDNYPAFPYHSYAKAGGLGKGRPWQL